MSTFSLEDFDKHIDNLRSQLQFLNGALDATDHKAPDWLATDLISLRNKSGRLQDDMQRFREQLESEGYGTRKTSNKRLSLEGAKPPNVFTKSEPSHHTLASSQPDRNPQQSPTPRPSEDDYVGQHVDVTEEVSRRLRESRLRRLMDSPSTSQKRKRSAFEEQSAENMGNAEVEGDENADLQRTPTKRLRASGSFEPTIKRKENGRAHEDPEEQNAQRANFKRRKV